MGSQSLFYLQIEVHVVRRTEILGHAECSAGIGLAASQSLRGDNLLARDDRGSSGGNREHGTRAARISLETVWRLVAGPVVKERVGVGRVEEHARTTADHEAGRELGLVTESNARADAVPVRIVNRLDVLALECDTCRSSAGAENR